MFFTLAFWRKLLTFGAFDAREEKRRKVRRRLARLGRNATFYEADAEADPAKT